MRAVVAGGAGFLGCHLSERLLAEGWDVVCVDNLLTGSMENISYLGTMTTRFSFMNLDISDSFSVLGPVDLVVHMASPASPPDYLRFPLETLRSGSDGTRALLEMAKEKNARFLLASTSEVYGDPEVHPQSEDYWGNVNPVGPRSVYDESKRFSEALVTAYRQMYDTNVAIARIFNTFGPRMRPDDGRAVPAFIASALAGTSLVINGDGMQTRSLCYVSDLVEGLVRLIYSSHQGPINIGNPREVTVLELAKMVRERCASGSEIDFVCRSVDDPRRRRPDIGLASSVLEWKPEVSLEDGLDLTIRWFKACMPPTCVG